MKNLYLIVIAVVMTLSVSAQEVLEMQNSVILGSKNAKVSLFNDYKVDLDTLGWNEFTSLTGNVWSWGLTGGGWIFGTNVGTGTLPNNTFAQGFVNFEGGTFGIVGAWIWCNDAQILSGTGCDILIKAALIDGTKTYTIGSDQYTIDCPGTLLGQTSFHISEVDTVWEQAAGLTYAEFDTTIYMPTGGDFALIFQANACSTSGDTIGVFASDDGMTSQIFGDEYTWWLYPLATPMWTQVSHIFGGATRMPALFAVIDHDFVNVDEHNYFQGMQLTVSPNPASDVLTLNYGVKSDMNAWLEIYAINGGLVYSTEAGFKTAGSYCNTIDISNFPTGTYMVCVVSDMGRLTKKLIIE